MKRIAILDIKRTAIAKAFKGSLANIRPDDFAGKLLIKFMQNNNNLQNDIEDIVIGCAMPEAEQGMNIARIIALRANINENIPAMTINRFCSSGLQAIINLKNSIIANDIRIGIAGGIESMSFVPMGGNKFSVNPYLMDTNKDVYMSMGLTAEVLAEKFKISRQLQDEFSFNSHHKALIAKKNNTFNDEILSINIDGIKEFYKDECPREDTSLESLAQLQPAFKKDGSVTAGNSSQMSDGAAFCIMADEEYAKKKKLNILAYIEDYVVIGCAPGQMGLGPIYAINKLLKKINLTYNDIDIYEINEAFAVQILACIDSMKLNPKKVNVNGGAIALGHPLGCTGIRQVATIVYEMIRKQHCTGIVSMCIGGGMGAAVLIKLK